MQYLMRPKVFQKGPLKSFKSMKLGLSILKLKKKDAEPMLDDLLYDKSEIQLLKFNMDIYYTNIMFYVLHKIRNCKK